VSFKQTQSGDRCVDILVEKTRLNLSVSFLIALGKFIMDSMPMEKHEGGFVNHGYVGDAGHQPRIPENVKMHRPPSSADSTSGYYSSGVSCVADEQSGKPKNSNFKSGKIFFDNYFLFSRFICISSMPQT